MLTNKVSNDEGLPDCALAIWSRHLFSAESNAWQRSADGNGDPARYMTTVTDTRIIHLYPILCVSQAHPKSTDKKLPLKAALTNRLDHNTLL